MVKPLFDSCILIDYLQGVPEAREELRRYDESAISIVTWMEVMVGADASVEAATRAFLAAFEIIGIDAEIAERAVILQRGSRIRLPDALIKATADVAGALLVTRNSRDFPPDMPGVRIPYGLKG
ncbi:MAG: vapC [Proteobacteria bacterium]|nr:vapC [Pseudomonadota bacterium]